MEDARFGTLATSERGSALIYGLFGIVCVLLFLHYGHELLGSYDHPVIFGAIVAILTLISAFSLGCAVHLRAIGGKPLSKLYEEIVSQAKAYDQLLIEAKAMIAELTPLMANHTGVVSRRAVDCLSIAKKIIAALEARLEEVASLLQSQKQQDIIEAYELMSKNLAVTDTRYDTLIDSDPIPAFEASDIGPTLSRLVQAIHTELRKVAA